MIIDGVAPVIFVLAILASGAALGFSVGRRMGATTEFRLRDVEARNGAILDAAVDGIITIDEMGIVRSVNRAAERIFGYTGAEVIGRNVSMLMPEPYRSAHDRFLLNYLSTGQAKIIGLGREVEGQRKDGSTFPMDLAVGEGVMAGGRIFAGIVRDITERKQVQERLRDSEERFRALVEGVRDYAITMLDPKGRIISWNQGAERLYGWTAEDAIGQMADEPIKAVAIALHTGRHEDEGWRTRRNGSRFWAHVVLTAQRDDRGRVAGLVRIAHDTTEHKRHEDALRRAKEEAERANLAKTKFLAAASHDLRQPVQSIFFFTSVLSHKLRGHAAEPLLDDLQNSVEGLNILLDSLLDVSKLDAGLVTPKETDFNVNAILDRMAAEFAPLAADKGLRLKVVPSGAAVRSDPALLSRVIQNLMANAVRYTPRGRILLGCRRRGDRLAIEVWDTGIGIPEDRIPEIFEEFTQLGNPERDRTQGLGLGLAIVARLGRLMGLDVNVRSTPGRGSVFRIMVPRGVSVTPARAAAKRTAAAVDGKRMVVLIDDEPIVLRGLTMVLENWGYEVIAATSEAEAMEKLAEAQRRPSVILADYRLREGHTGTEAVMHIRNFFDSAIPSIIITGDTAPERLREAEASGLSILHKPIQPPALREILRETLEQSSGNRLIH